MKFPSKIPTLVALIILLLGTFFGVFLTGQNQNPFSRASTDCRPINPQVTNITHNSLDISFTTSSSCSTALNIDNRLINDLYPSGQVHYFPVNNLQPGRQYAFSFINNGATYSKDEYQITTATQPSGQLPASNIAWGRVFNPDQTPATDSVVYLNIPGASPLSAIVTSNGNWNISLALSLNQEKDSWFNPPENITEDIFVISKENQVTQVIGNTSQNNPVPDIIIGQNRLDNGNHSVDTPLIPTVSQTQSSNNSPLNIINPNDGETIGTFRPDFFGSGPPNSQLIIKVESPETISDQTSTRNDGSWNWSPSQNLAPGEHTITVSYQNPISGTWETVKRNFFVNASDNSLAFSASSSAVHPSPTLTLTPTPTPAVSQPSPTIKTTPTATIIPTSTPVIRTSKPSTESGIPETGLTSFTFIPIVLSLIVIVLAFVLSS